MYFNVFIFYFFHFNFALTFVIKVSRGFSNKLLNNELLVPIVYAVDSPLLTFSS